MAHWTDGPEYAPTERPDVFVEPDAAPLGHDAPAPTQAAPTASAPAAPPQYTSPDAPALDALVPATAPERDPHEAFDIVATPMTAWGNAHAPVALPAPAPQAAPPAVNPDGFPQPGPPPWEPPPPPPAFEPVTFAAILRNATPGVLIVLALGGIVYPFALALLILASVLASRIRYRRRIIGRMFSGAIVGSLLLGIAGLFGFADIADPFGWYDASTGWAQVACLVMLVAVPLVVGDAMRRGEEPEGWA